MGVLAASCLARYVCSKPLASCVCVGLIRCLNARNSIVASVTQSLIWPQPYASMLACVCVCVCDSVCVTMCVCVHVFVREAAPLKISSLLAIVQWALCESTNRIMS